jgi:hypothetical protein
VTPTDVDVLEETLRGITAPMSVLILSPAWDAGGLGLSERAVVGRVWPEATVIEVDKGRWDLDGPRPSDVPHVPIGIICNTFMCSHDPAGWLDRLLDAVDLLVVQDLAVCRRGPGGTHCAVETGDVSRYSVSSHGIVGETDPDRRTFDFSSCGHRVLDAHGYDDRGSLKFLAFITR